MHSCPEMMLSAGFSSGLKIARYTTSWDAVMHIAVMQANKTVNFNAQW